MVIEERPKPRNRIFYVLLWVLMLVIAISVIFVVFSLLIGFSPQRVVSLDWSGYVVTSDYFNSAPVITGVNASWIVPKVTATPDDRLSAAWIGIGGYLDNSLIQVGTEHDSISGEEAYSAWYELLPNDSITIPTMRIQAGDKINASITLLNLALNSWSVKITDVTTGQGYGQQFIYNSSRLSAEWIVERPTVDHSVSPLANFGSVTFTSAVAVNNVTEKAINGFSFSRVTMYDRQNRQLVSVSSLVSNGESFTVDYLNADSAVSNSTAILKTRTHGSKP